MSPDSPDPHSPPLPPAEYSFGQPVRLLHPFMALTVDETSAVIMHEAAHLELARETSFGMFQCLLGYLARCRAVSSNLRKSYRAALVHTIDHSRHFHEAYATICELLFAGSVSFEMEELVRWSMSPFARQATDPLGTFFNQADFPAVLSKTLLRAIAEAILNTSILEDMKLHSRFLNVDWAEYYRSPHRNPDSRYEVFCSKVHQGDLPQALSQAILKHLGASSYNAIPRGALDRFNDRHSRKKRSREFGIAKGIARNVLKQALPFSVGGPQERIRLYEALFESWSGTLADLPIRIGRGPPILRRTRQSSTDFYLSKMDYVPRVSPASRLKKAIQIDPLQWTDFHQLLSDSKAVVYVHLRPKLHTRAHSQQTMSEATHSQGVSLYFHEFVMLRDAVQFRWFGDHRTVGLKAKTSALESTSGELLDRLSDLSHLQCVYSLHERRYKRFRSFSNFQAVRELIPDPLVIYPNGSTTNHWRRVVRSLARKGEVYIYHHQIASKPYRALDLCYAVPADGRIAYVRPTPHPTFRRLLQLEPELITLERWHQFNSLFSDSWVGRLRIAAMHYYIFGF